MIHDNTILSSCNLCYHSVSVNIPQKKLTRLDDLKSWNIIISLRTLDASQRYYTITLKNIIVHVVFNWQKHPPLATTLREEPTFCTAHASFDKHRWGSEWYQDYSYVIRWKTLKEYMEKQGKNHFIKGNALLTFLIF